MKSALTEVVSLYEGLFKDLSNAHPSIATDLSRDLQTIRRASVNQGLPLFTITLPDLAKYLRRCLDSRMLHFPPPFYLGAKNKEDKRPRLFYGLWCMIFEADGTLQSEPDIGAIADLHQLLLAAKKLNLECETRYVEKTIDDFRETERSLPRSWDNTWDSDVPIWCRRDGHPIWGSVTVDDRQTYLYDDQHPLSRMDFEPDWAGFRNFVARFSAQLGDLNPFEIRPKHGPGAVSDKTDYTKYDQLYWTKRLQDVFPYDWFGAPSYEHLDYVDFREFPSRLIAVPKTQSGPRLIACEPTSHQWIQGGIQRWIEDKLRNTILKPTIDFRSQDVSRQMALESSKSASHATIDLKSASDRLTTRLVEFCFQGNRSLLDALHACRTRCVEVNPGELILLRKFSTQGSACTFPVQSIVFSLLAIWSVAVTRNTKTHEDLTRIAKEVRVFGDDIIVPTDAYEVLTALLTSCLLKVNDSKSFAHGSFRESCGMDAYDGVDITPAYLRQIASSASTSLASLIECANNFFLKGYWHASKAIEKMVADSDIKNVFVRAPDSGAFGLVSFCGNQTSHLKERWNGDLQRKEIRILTTIAKVVRRRSKGHGDLLQFFVEEPDPFFPYEGGQVASVKARKVLAWVDYHQQMVSSRSIVT